jgi:hypothetical protein
LARDFADAGLINIGHDQPESRIYNRKLRLVTDPRGQTFRPELEHGVPEPPKSARQAHSTI